MSKWVHQLNKCASLVRDVNDGGGFACVGQRVYGKKKISVLFSKFCNEPKTAFKKSV